MTPIRPLAATGLLSVTLLATLIGFTSDVRADVSGVVFVDLDRNSVRDDGEPGLAGVAISNGGRRDSWWLGSRCERSKIRSFRGLPKTCGPIWRAPGRGTGSKGPIATYLEYSDEFRRPGSELCDVHAKIENAFGKIAELRPDFALATGDLVLDANGSSAETLESWIQLYLRNLATIEQSGATVYNLIGNHELREIRDRDPQDPEYGTGFFEATSGPATTASTAPVSISLH